MHLTCTFYSSCLLIQNYSEEGGEGSGKNHLSFDDISAKNVSFFLFFMYALINYELDLIINNTKLVAVISKGLFNIYN